MQRPYLHHPVAVLRTSDIRQHCCSYQAVHRYTALLFSHYVIRIVRQVYSRLLYAEHHRRFTVIITVRRFYPEIYIRFHLTSLSSSCFVIISLISHLVCILNIVLHIFLLTIFYDNGINISTHTAIFGDKVLFF